MLRGWSPERAGQFPKEDCAHGTLYKWEYVLGDFMLHVMVHFNPSFLSSALGKFFF